ncbi:MAG TPA: hypothetical protein VG271_08735, partial [Beijerinckiaceae bacterium]|nr:hypothetical protein [Beijerinckiaceae bacterium]
MAVTMIARRTFCLSAVSITTAGLAGCAEYFFFRMKMTADVEVDQVVRTGSSTIEFKATSPPSWLEEMWNVQSRARGEAAVVDLGERGLLFVTLSGQNLSIDSISYFDELPWSVFWRTSQAPDKVGGARNVGSFSDRTRLIASSQTRIELNRDEIPLLVHFRNVNDPTSVEIVDPTNLAASFGSGTSLLRVTLEITRDPVSRGIGNVLPWLDSPNQDFPTAGKIG